MKMKNKTLRKQFVTRMLIVLISITVISGAIQFYLSYGQVEQNVENEAMMIGQSIEQGITETDLAERAIEQQIDYKLEDTSERIGELLPEKAADISNSDLIKVNEKVKIAGIDIFKKEDGVISVSNSTDPEEIGFTLKGISEEGNNALEQLLMEEKPNGRGIASYINDNIVILYTAQAGSREEPQFFKYAYYHQPGTDYIISAFIEANEVYQFTQEVGPSAWIEKVLTGSEFSKEIAILDPRVFADPSLAERMYPPLKKVVYGKYTFRNDEKLLIDLLKSPKRVSYIDNNNGEKIYKMFIPYDEGRVIYIALDYEKMSAPLKNNSLLLIVFGFLALLLLFIITARFFSDIYNNIAKIINQIKSLEKGDFTSRSHVEDGGELSDLSKTTNKMAETLNKLIGETREQATETERHAYLLEAEANNSVEKVYSMSVDTTTTSREAIEEIDYFLNELEGYLQQEEGEKAKSILGKVDEVREQIRAGTNSTTEMTITLADLLKSLHNQSASLSDISKKLLKNMAQFELNTDESQNADKNSSQEG
ncbi:methyl-accepting chemotaxis protein [Aquibacillus sp. 3ASR75-11]|uniref:Methyl-accepting chemotaxis protein n=1 Tax=Terrihalobacillus insolitus TaxID=2950438 RepID=A0A9X3WYZ5_9BACI|nr:methyl-accepting chemotaxis protein [Terrihalobacillus insolitus]MDC3414981.1 methyl-accepting chemotaxis protein [Terrihalobacillus insolitus]MDC3425884.1 methyl-accepting chemotaxis protein [Terrihalobacillus insolitus]